MSFDKELNVIVINVIVENNNIRKKVRMALDTGATYTMIPWEIAETLGIRPELSKERTEMITASGVEKVPVIILEKVGIGDKEAENVKAIVHDLPPKSYVDGLLGLSFLRNFNIHLNFKTRILEIE